MNKKKRIHHLVFPGMAAVALAGWMACNKGFDRVVQQKDYTDTTSAAVEHPHVLYVIVNGARGESVRDAKPPHIMSLTDHAIYCWNSVTDTLTLNVTTWADLLTGVHKEKHGVINKDLNDNNLKNYPIFFNRIKERKPDMRIAAFSASDSLKDLITGADINRAYSDDDAAVQNAALQDLKTDSASLVMVQYNEVDDAGVRYGYDVSVPQYKDAILQVDDYIGKLLDAVRSRKDYVNEGWLVVITSNRGGPYLIDPARDDHTILSNPETNSFDIFYSPQYQPSFIDKPYTGNRYIGSVVELNGSGSSAVYATVADDDNDYNFGSSVEFTIEMKVKIGQDDNGDIHNISDYPSLLSKRESFNRDIPGWTFYLHDKHWAFLAEQVGGFTEAIGPDIADGTWHDIAAVVLNRDGKRYARIYTDGNFNKEQDITSRGNISSKGLLTLGYMEGIGAGHLEKVNVSDLKIWRAALSDATIGSYACEPGLADNHPNIDQLIGYWPCLDGTGGEIKDHATLQHDFDLHGPYQWKGFNDLVCPPPASDLASKMPQPVDIPTQILNWLQIPTDPKWDLDGRVWTTGYVGVKQ